MVFVGVVNSESHGGEERGLRTREVVGAIGVKEGSVVFDLEDEVIDHAFCEFDALVFEQADDDEVAIPAIHLVEASAWHYVFIRKVEESVALKLIDVEGSSGGDFLGQVLDSYFALLGSRASLGCGLNFGGEVEDGFARGELGINECFAGDGIAGERVPRRMDVGDDVGFRGRSLSEDSGGCQEQ